MRSNDIERAIDTTLSGLTTTDARKEQLLRAALTEAHPCAPQKPEKQPSRVKLKWHFSLSFGLSHMIVAAVVIIIVIVAPLFAPETKTNFDTWQSEDGEYYMVHGQGKAQNQQVAEADHKPTEYGMFDCATLDEVEHYYGTIPPIPTWLPEGTTCLAYNVGTTENGRNFTAIYLLGEGTVVYTVFENYEGLYYTYVEQSEEGEYVTLAGGQEVYITKNIDHLSLFWTDNDIEFMLSGAFTREEAIRMAESVRIP